MKFCLKQKLEEIKFWTTFILGIFRVSIWNFKFWAVKIELSFVESFFSLYSLFFPLPHSVCRRSSCSSPPGCLPMPSFARSSLRRPHPYPKPAACSLPRLPGSAPFLLPIAPTDRARAAQCQPAKSVGHTSSLSDSARPSLPHPFLSSLLAYEGSSGHRCGWSSTSRGRWAPHGSCQSPCWWTLSSRPPGVPLPMPVYLALRSLQHKMLLHGGSSMCWCSFPALQ